MNEEVEKENNFLRLASEETQKQEKNKQRRWKVFPWELK